MKRIYLAKENLSALQKSFPESISFDPEVEEPAVLITKQDYFLDIMQELHSNYRFDMLSSITAVDYTDHFEVVYDLLNRTNNEILMVKISLANTNPSVESVINIWQEADYQEREQYDLMGINFLHHPNLKRILLADDFVGHPLLKSYKRP